MQGDEVSPQAAPGYLAQDGEQDPAIRRMIDARHFPGRGRIAANGQSGIHTEGSGSGNGFTEILLHSFTGNPFDPIPGLVMDSAGNLYGTITYAGTADAGIVFKVDPTGKMTVLYNFQVGTDGRSPRGSLITDKAGNLYGTTFYGGTAGGGTVFKVDPTGKETVLYSFQGGTDGEDPYAGLIMDNAGNLYGTTWYGGTAGTGTVFKLDPTGKETVLYSFQGGADGEDPYASLIMDNAGNLYGTTYSGGTCGDGIVFKVDPTGKETVLYNFQGGADGANSRGGLVMDSTGNLYGTTLYGGTSSNCSVSLGCGTVFKLDPTGKKTVLYSFQGGTDGSLPYAGLIMDSAGNLYGTTGGGGKGGTVFEMDPTGKKTVLYSFQGSPDGKFPTASLIMDSAGNLYGTTVGGGTVDGGSVFKVDSTGKETVLYSFTYTNDDGFEPAASLIMDTAGNFYGTTDYGGANADGTVFKLDATGDETVLHSFPDADGDGLFPGGLIMDSAGNLYGTTVGGGTASFGTVFKVDPTGKETVLYSFQGGTDGEAPYGSLIMDSAGNLYGTTIFGGTSSNCGSLGCGTIFILDPTGKETVLYSFQGGTDGDDPYASLIMDSAGNLYGTTRYGGTANFGTVFKVDPTGKETVLYSFQGGTDGEYPYAGLIMDSAGNLYGTTMYGGAATGIRAGTVFKVDPTGKETLL